jgi:glycosyltransferase involved in cell wall biosynthesis
MGVEVAQLCARPGERELARRALGLERFTVLYLGRLSREKGPDLAVAALPREAELLIAGAGPEERALRLGARGRRVRFLGEVRGADKRRLLAAADALVVPSREDGAPTVVREAHAAGLPLVATRVGGLPELVRDGVTGLLCATDAAHLARALERLGDDRALGRRLAERGLAEASAYGWDTIGPQLWGSRLGGLDALRPKGRQGGIKVLRV